MISSISLFDIISVVTHPELGDPQPKTFFWIPASAADTAVVNPYGIKKPLTNDWNTFFINSKPTFVNGLRSLEKNSIWLHYSQPAFTCSKLTIETLEQGV